MSIGGNDIGFGNILQSCVIPRVSRHTGANTCFSTYEDRLEVFQLIDRTMPRWTALFRQLQREAPGSRIYAIGYPQIALDSGDCARNVNLSQGELQFATSLIDYLNNDIEQAALAANITYVDISQALVGYRLCEAASHAVAMNGLTAGKDGGPLGTKIFGKESYHPNALGQSLIAQAILRATNNLSASSLPPSTNPPHPALNVPNSGRTLQTRLPATDLTAAVIKSDVSVVLQANGAEHGLKPLSTYAIRLDGSTGQVIAATASNESGDLDTTIVIPSTVAPGGHTIDVIGTNLAGIAVNLTQPVYIQASDSDTDGDTIPDNLDTCPGAAQTNTDTDRDGIDDVCDVLISAPSAPPTVPAAVSSAPANTAPTAPAAPPSTPSEPPAPIIGIPPSDSAVVIQNQSGRTQGVTTSNPQATGHASQPAKAATSAKQRPAQISTSMPALAPKINWKPWVFIPMTLWWTSIIVIYLCWIASRRKQAQYL